MAKAKELPSDNYRVQAKITIDGKVVCKSFTNQEINKAELAAKGKDNIQHARFTNLKKIINAVTGTPIELPVKLAIRLGLRMSEIRGLKWSAIHDDYIVIDNVIVSVDNKPVEKQPKSTAGFRKIPLPDDMKQLINAQPKINDFIIQDSEKSIGARFRRTLKNNNIPHCRFHDLRHANASAMALLGIPDRYAMKIGGWDTPEVLRNVYQQTFTDEKKSSPI